MPTFHLVNPQSNDCLSTDDSIELIHLMGEGFEIVPEDIYYSHLNSLAEILSEANAAITPHVVTNEVVHAPCSDSFSKEDVIELFDLDPRFVDHAIRLIGENQTADEILSAHTKYNNGLGFTAAYGTTGTRLYTWVTGADRSGNPRWPKKSVRHPRAEREFKRYINNHGLTSPLELAKKVALVHWKQLGALFAPAIQVDNLPCVDAPKKSNKPVAKKVQTITLTGAEVKRETEKAFEILWDSRRVWLPKSRCSLDSAGNPVIPEWLAAKNNLAA